MPPTPLEIIKAKAMNFKQILKDTPQSEKKGNVSSTLADEFNKLIDAVGQEKPETKPHLPDKLHPSRMFVHAGVVDAKYVDLEILVNNLISVISAYEK